jgi:hypothetical protein
MYPPGVSVPQVEANLRKTWSFIQQTKTLKLRKHNRKKALI